MSGIIAPIFAFGDSPVLSTNDAYTRASALDGQLCLSGPSTPAPAGHEPVRGDLAHVRLAGIHFVPHYAVPMPRAVAEAGARLLDAGRESAALVEVLRAGTVFNVLDIAGGWAWGQVGEDGFVGYLPVSALENV